MDYVKEFIFMAFQGKLQGYSKTTFFKRVYLKLKKIITYQYQNAISCGMTNETLNFIVCILLCFHGNQISIML